jgi:mannitol-1-phosphate 5-dehydrogenase
MEGEQSLSLMSNGYPELPVDAQAFKGPPLVAPLIRLCTEFTAESVRKTYTLNMAQAAMAYLGSPLGLQFAVQAIEHPDVRPYIQQGLEEAAHGLCGEYGFTPEEMADWNGQIFTMLENPALGEPLNRLGVDVGRKVGLHERLVGAAQLCQRHGRAPVALARAIAYAYLYRADDPGTRRLQDAVANEGIELALERCSQLDYRSRLRALVLEEYERATEDDIS